jgi:lipoate---protein ligase
MELLELTLPTAAENVALDEALLDAAEEGNRRDEILRIWELRTTAVIVGRSSRVQEEVDVPECRRQGVQIVRRTSGGAAVVAGPGCLMYSLLLSYRARPALRFLDQAHRFVLDHLAAALARHVPGVTHSGTSDLALGERKFSGNSLRAKRGWCLYHGTLLYDFALPRIGSLLKTAPRQPAYRQGRSHDEFVANLPLAREALVRAVSAAFGADQSTIDWPQQQVASLVRQRYGQAEWTFQR